MTNIIEFTICCNNKNLNVLTHKLDEPEYILIHLHGLHSTFQFTNESPDEFKNRVKILQKGNIISYALEFNGHGKSQGYKGYLNNFDLLLDDVDALINYVSLYHPDKPIYILGESMGGAVAVKYYYLKKNKIKGIIMLSPLFGISNLPNYFLTNCILGLSYIFPSVNLKSLYDRENTSDNMEYIELLKKNKYNFTDILTLCSIRECYNFCNWWKDNIDEIDIPVLIFHSEFDKTTNFNETKNFFNRCNNKLNDLISFKNTNHNLLVPQEENDFIPYIILNKISFWINNGCKKLEEN